MTYQGVSAAVGYAHAVARGDEVVCELTRLACARFLADLATARSAKGQWEFRPELAEAGIVFAEQLSNIKGPLAGQPLRLMPWQCMIFACLLGFVERGTDTRRFRQGVIFVPRGNGKTTLAAPLALYLTFCDSEGGAEGYAAAVTRDQAKILFDAAQHMVRRAPAFRAEYGVEVAANAIHQAASASRFGPVSSDAKSLDGLNVAVAVCDEIASHRTAEVYDTLLTATGKRRHPLLLSISTATGNSTGIGRQLWDYAVRVLRDQQQDDRLFALIYTIDDADDPWAEETWVKANPGWGQSVQPDAVRAIMVQARNNIAQESIARTRHLNIWAGADDALFSLRAWRECADKSLSLDDFEGQGCFVTVDLAARIDLAVINTTFVATNDQGQRIYTTFHNCYLNDAAVMEARNPSYPGWAAAGYLTITPGNETDFGQIEADLIDLCRRFNVKSIGYDPWAATQLAQRLQAQGAPVIEYRATTPNFSEPCKELDAAMRAGRVRHDGNPVVEWCIGNVVGHYDARGNVYPRKSRPEHKIDAAITLIMAIGLAMAEPESPYANRGLIYI